MSTDPDAPICAKVGDFGLSQKVAPFLDSALQTWGWMAPEALKGSPYTELCDVYSFGIVAWEIADER